MDADENPVTEAGHGRRYVKLAQRFGNAAYIYSICNPDWTPAMTVLAAMIEKRVR